MQTTKRRLEFQHFSIVDLSITWMEWLQFGYRLYTARELMTYDVFWTEIHPYIALQSSSKGAH